ncbi:hypothetical protein [Phycicoccus sp. 3266]|uniref:hypothetical protein n=1 Tax=Phycicoccus sp. 3266 TaxID=2817751 RepID=UPI0028598A01|nr:hypothetical protein [Phycicoccus sp. 3266]MDR6862425.1 hypothetical protein [Phycicoccus sp. 3266]
MTENRSHAERALSPRAVDALLLDTTPWLSCDDCFTRMDTHVEALLRTGTSPDPVMDRHLQGCVACSEEAESMLALLRDDSL